MKAFLRPIAILLTAILFVQAARSQTPVQVTPQLLPPYSLQASEYYSGIQPKLQVLLLNRDISQPTIQVKLRLTIESQNCRMQTKLNAITPTFTLTSGIPYYMSPSELQAFFTASNIDFGGGYTEQQYLQTGRLPEGLYSFYIEAFELNTGNLVSNKGFTLGWLTLADPPMLNTPSRAEGVSPTNPQNIVFNWTPRHNTSPTAGYLTDYIFSIAEYNDINIGPEASFSSSPPLFIDSVQTTTYLFGAGQPQLVPGKRYAWRVQAKAKNGTVPLAMFRNNGYSEVYWFTYQNNCAAPVGIGHTVQGVRATIEWTNNPQHMEWRVEYREKNNPDAQWFSINNTIPRVMLTDLRPATQYEYRVGGSCIAGQFTYSTLFSFTTAGSPVSPVANCGDSVLVSAGGGQLLQNLNAGDTLRAGTFTVNVGHSSGVGSFTGMGFVKVPWLMNAKVEVRFTNITLSLDRKLISGVIETTYDPTESGIGDIDEYIDIFVSGYGLGGVITGQISVDTTVGFPILWPGGISVTLPPGYNPITGLPAPGTTIPIVLTNAQTGAQTTLQVSHLPTTLQDANGNIYQVNANGVASLVGMAGGNELLQNMNKKVIDGDKALVVYKTTAGAKYAFDQWQPLYKKSSTVNKEYEKIPCTSGGLSINDGYYYVNAKAIAPAVTDTILAVVRKPAGSTISKDSIQFVNSKGTKFVKTAVNDSTFAIVVVGGPEKDAQEIYAVYKQSAAKTLNFGKLLVASYPKQNRKLALVPVKGAQINRDSVYQKLNSVYNKVNIFWDVELESDFGYSGWDLNNDNKLSVDGTSLLSSLTDEMKNLNGAYIGSRGIDPGTIYLFVLNQAAENVAGVQILGDMPRGKQFGYIFTANGNQGEAARTAAHEIGHGVFRLKHIFEYGDITKGLLVPSNLMDYPAGEFLSKFQWDNIHDPAIVFGIFEKDEDAQNQITYIDKKFLNPDNTTVSFLTENGQIISIVHSALRFVELSYGSMVAPQQDPSQGLSYHFATASGCLRSFTILENGENKKYKYNATLKSYINDATGQPYTYSVSDFNTQVNGFVFPMPAGDKYILYKFGKNGITAFVPGTGTNYTFGEVFTVVKPFTNINPALVDANNVVIEQSLSEVFYKNCYWCRDENTSVMTAPYVKTPQLFYIDKAAQLRVVFPEYFKKFTQSGASWEKPVDQVYAYGGTGGGSAYVNSATNWVWGQYLVNNPTVANYYTTDKEEYFRKFCYEFRNYVDTQIVRSQTFWANLSDATPVTDIINHLSTEPIFQTSKAPIEKRKKALERLGNSGTIPESKENAIIRILASIDPDDQGGVIDHIIAHIGLQRVFNKFDDSFMGIGSDNFTKIVTILSGFIQNPQPNSDAYEKVANIENPKMISIDQDIFDNRQTNLYTINSDNTITFVDFNNSAIYENIPYNQLVPIKFWSSFELGGVTYPKGYIMQVPAMFAALLVDKGEKALFSKKAWLVFDGIMLVVGAGEIKLLFKGVSWLRKAAIVSNMVGSTMDIVLNVLNDGAIPQSIKSKLQIGCLLLQLPDMVNGVNQLFKNSLHSKANDITAYLQGDGASLGHNSKYALNKMVNMAKGDINDWEEVARFDNYVVALGQGDLTTATNWIGSTSGVQNKALVLAHSNGTDFNVLRRLADGTESEAVINHRSLKKWIESKNIPSGNDIVLLSCNDQITAQNLANKLNRKVIASDGEVKVLSNGNISSENDFLEFSPATGSNPPPPTVSKGKTFGTSTVPPVNEVVLGGGWRNFINDLNGPKWEQPLKNTLKSRIEENPGLRKLFSKASDNEKANLAESWYLLYQRAINSNSLNNANALFKNPKAIEALSNIRKNQYLSKLDLNDDILASIKSHQGASYDEILNDLDLLASRVGGNPETKLENFNQALNVLTGDNVNYRQGVHWMIKDVAAESTKFDGKTLTFEYRVTNVAGNNAYVDLKTNHVPPLFIEYKSGPGSVTKTTFLNQFIGRDLLNANKLAQIEWRMINRNLTKDEVILWMTSPEGRTALEPLFQSGKLQGMFPPNIIINSVDKFITEMTKDNIFNAIFRNK